MYEYLITLGHEIELFWKGRGTGAAALFYLNRYLGLLSNIYALVVDHGDASHQVRESVRSGASPSLHL